MNTSNTQRTDTEDSRTDHASASGCCGGPAPVGTSACCAEDAVVKATGGTGCGCDVRRSEKAEEAILLRLVNAVNHAAPEPCTDGGRLRLAATSLPVRSGRK